MNHLKFGNYQHEDYECELSISMESQLNDAGVPYQRVHRWNIKGWLFSDSGLNAAQAHVNLTNKINALKAAYAKPVDSVAFYLDNVKTAKVIEGTLGGIRCVSGPNFPESNNGEYSTFVRYELAIEGTVPVSGTELDPLISFNESLSFQGNCGPIFKYIQVINGTPQKQIVAQRSTMTATQAGSAVGYGSWPLLPQPLWPSDEHLEARVDSKTSPRRIGQVGKASFVEYERSWSYSFESAVPLSGNPNRFTIV